MIVKCQDYIHNNRKVWMSDWVREALPVEPFDQVNLVSPSKINDPKWKRQLSVRSVHTVFWIYRKDGQMHRVRKAS
jgi:hypothetical protein